MRILLSRTSSSSIFVKSLLSFILLGSTSVYAIDLDKEYRSQASDKLPTDQLCEEKWEAAQAYKDSSTRYWLNYNSSGVYVDSIIKNSRGCYVSEKYPLSSLYQIERGITSCFITCENNNLIRYSKLSNGFIVRDKIAVFFDDYCPSV